jgi:hypothetical protein
MAAQGISKRVLHALGIGAEGLTPREQKYRESLRLKLKAELIPTKIGEQIPGGIPGCSEIHSMTDTVIPIPWAGLSILAEKIARSCEYKQMKKRFIEPPYVVRVSVPENAEIGPPFLPHSMIQRKVFDFGPGCEVIRVSSIENENIARYRILIWGKICLNVVIDHEDYISSELYPRVRLVEGTTSDSIDGMQIPPYLREFK